MTCNTPYTLGVVSSSVMCVLLIVFILSLFSMGIAVQTKNDEERWKKAFIIPSITFIIPILLIFTQSVCENASPSGAYSYILLLTTVFVICSYYILYRNI